MNVVVRILNTPNLSIYEKMLLTVIASYGSGKVGAIVGYKEIIEQGSMSKQTAIKCVKSLISKGYLERELNRNMDGGLSENTYILKIKTEDE